MDRTGLVVFKLLVPPIFALLLRLGLWMEGLIYHRSRPDPVFRRVITNNATLFVLGMGYIVLWRVELGGWLHWAAIWKILLSILAAMVAERTVRQLRSAPCVPPHSDAPEPAEAAKAAKY